MKLLTILSMIFLLLIIPNFSQAQADSTTTKLEKLELSDGSILIGSVVSEDNQTIQFHTQAGVVMTIEKSKIKNRKLLQGQYVSGELWNNDPNRTRLFFAPTGRALKAGQGYFSAYEIFFPFIAVGVTDFLTLAGGVTLFPGATSQLFYFAPKITPLSLEKFDLSAGVLFIKIPNESDWAGITYGVGTYGTEKAALTAGLGFGFFGGDFAEKPVYVLGGEVRMGKGTKFITENWLIPGSDVQIVSGGIRFFGENLAADFAFFYPAGADTEGFPFLPWIGFVYNFGQ
jgi:hypothetical protein